MTRVSKEKQEKTLKKMKDRRAKDSIHLRTLLEKKLEWSKAEMEKGLELIKKHEAQVKILKEQVLKLEGSIISLTQIQNESTVKDAGDKN